MKNKKKQTKERLVIYQAKSGAINLKGDFSQETVWASLDQIAQVFERDKSVISRHIKNIFRDGELKRDSVVAFFATTAADGKTYQVEYFDLDVILSVGYKVNSKRAIQFRQWATRTLREYITRGYVIDRRRVGKHAEEFLSDVEDIKRLAKNLLCSDDAIELVKAFADTWLSLTAYDKGDLPKGGTTKRTVALTSAKLERALAVFKTELSAKHEATGLFGQERQAGAIGGIVGNVMQSFGGQALYPTIEEKAAHILYFIVKDHPFTDGNKRSGAYAFVWFLALAKRLDRERLTPAALTALTLLVAESAPREKERMIGLVIRLLGK